MARQYYTLLVRDDKASDWGIHFGDYGRECVDQEREDIVDAGEYAKSNTKIIKTDDDQASIDEEVRVQNVRFG